jgi:putative alpha-1,2-mannosidase
VERIAKRFYRDAPNGLVGNDDCGQMSAWLVFATLGFYPAQPGQAQYTIGLPLVKKAQLNLGSGAGQKSINLQVQSKANFNRQRSHQIEFQLDGKTLIAGEPLNHEALLQANQLDFKVI